MSRSTEAIIPSQLDTKSISTPPSNSFSYRDFLLKHHQTEMDAVELLYMKLNMDFPLMRLRNCRTSAVFQRENATGRVKVSSNSCHVKFCPLCASAAAYRIRTKTEQYLAGVKGPKFLTLTLRHSPSSLRDQLDKLYDSFKTLRKIKLWRKCVKGGMWFFEIKRGKDDMWHPHLHIVLDSAYMSKFKVSEAWERITTDSPIIDIRQVKDPKKVAEYVAKYATKPMDLKNLDMDERIELLSALRKRRLNDTFGTAKKFGITKKPEFVKENWTKLGNFRTVIALYHHDDNARQIFDAWRNKEELPDGVSVKLVDEFILGDPPPDFSEHEIDEGIKQLHLF